MGRSNTEEKGVEEKKEEEEEKEEDKICYRYYNHFIF